ncbi:MULTISPECIES: succinate dehydrogenase flavoprotein subunit [Aneurinibacillus]|uniref:succinate dehydrogenase n=1 Tax=Aneurinibacillus thermoaerophilus TaxID=143495 RepID=A0A1G8EHQ9_ANETH|nr:MULTISPECIES: succinate dehydrogenase flavoprotein subunit [Aneurinibacillus]AMA72056.1 succinate dehydrogenase [Aneurinibacillus sp. XH2]MED0677453.1 succinate dehydrogenase flavoprotein subunit [Aneurinibacillus thermoaerophilus]MED0678859.1 succinate dehydrogenase flavoprotein subunit [Aneurinibacillus thermoaerophilus]MED0736396.1 succinate dehydrogenase flavoprotein subunit [Aneurinibacillus thermoaerophilus]MED0755890.1 succinate dehydrogenase flavoprotein subunit [Aneurinibacillus th
MNKGKIIVVGGGLAGLMSTIKASEAGYSVELFSLVPVKRSHSVCAQGGINGAVNTKGEGDSPWIHFDDTIYGGDFLANQPPVKAMCEAAPGIIYMFDRMGVMFNRTSEGLIDFRRFGGTQHHRTAFAGATTGQQLLYALDEQVRRWEVNGLVTKYEGWEFLSIVQDDEGICRGIVAQNLRSMEIKAFRADAVILATGGPGIIFGKSTNSIINTGTAASAVYQQGATYANGEFIQIHPTAIPGDDKLRLMSESARGEGGRVWTYKDGKPWYFLEEKYPAYGNLVPRDIATREIFHVCVDLKLGINGENMVYLDLSHKDPHELDVKLGGIIEIYEKFVGDDPRKVPMKIFPAVHYSMGGLWVDYNQMTNIPGLFAAGECDYSQHGANRLGANSLLSAVYGGMVAGPKAIEYIKGLDKSSEDVSSTFFDAQLKKEQEKYDRITSMTSGTENAYLLHRELGEWMTDNVTVVRYNDKLKKTDEKIQELMERYQNININDTSKWSNTGASFTRQLWNMLVLARVITIGALMRNESRGAHYKPEFPERDDENFLKTTMANFDPETKAPKISYEDVDISLIKPRKRDYSKKSTVAEKK